MLQVAVGVAGPPGPPALSSIEPLGATAPMPMNGQFIDRVVDRELDELLPQLPAIALEGPKAVGKTETDRCWPR